MAIQAKPLANTEVKAAKAIDKELSLHDGGGLLLYVKPSGTKTWRFRYYHPQTKKCTTLTFATPRNDWLGGINISFGNSSICVVGKLISI